MRQEEDKFVLRMPEGMRNHIREQAEKSRRSMNAEIIHYVDMALKLNATTGERIGVTTPAVAGTETPKEASDANDK